ncbi:MAG: 50S ribosomal protein L21 [Candidatus Omnitrophica bacterium]|nr:50S ribosomal protein L21 [Candidatus Omnitrophota bacterium]
MWAVIELSNKQYLVEPGLTVEVERLPQQEGSLLIDKVLLVADDKNTYIGKPYLEKASVKAEIIEEKKAKKVLVYKFNRRKKYRKTQGHRQIHTLLKISEIVSPK